MNRIAIDARDVVVQHESVVESALHAVNPADRSGLRAPVTVAA